MKKILHISKYYAPFVGGIEQVARDCVNSFGTEVEQKVFCFQHEKGDAVDRVDGVEVIRAGCFAKVASQSMSFSYGKLLKKTFREFQPDIVIFHYPNPFGAHFLKKQLKRRPDCKLIVWWHLDITKQKLLGKLFAGQTKWLLKRAAKVVATSPNYIDGSASLQSVKEKCVSIPCCVNHARLQVSESDRARAEQYRQECAGRTICLAMGRHVPYKGMEYLVRAEQYRQECAGRTICLAMGRHVPYKGMEYLVRASKLLSDDFVVWIGGQGPLTDDLKKLAEGDRKITFLGKVSDDDLKSRLLACDIFCFPSITKNEAFGIALAEAMAYGKPAVTFTIDGSGVNYVSLNGVTGIEVENRNIGQYAEALRRLADDASLRGEYGENAKRRVEALFTNEKFQENVRNLIDQL